MAVQMEGLSFEVSAKTDGAAKQLDTLASSLERVKKAVAGGMNLTGASKQIEKIGNAAAGLNNYAVQKLVNLSKAIDSLSKVKSVTLDANLARRIKSVSESAAGITPEQIKNLKDFADALSGLKGLSAINIRMPNGGKMPSVAPAPSVINPADTPADEGSTDVPVDTTALDQNASLFDRLRAGAGGAADAIRQMGSALMSLGGVAADKVAPGLAGIVKNAASLPMLLGSRLASSVKQSTSSLGGLFSGLVRIAKFRLFRTIIKLFTEGMSKGLENLYYWSQTAANGFSSAMDRISTSASYVSNSFAAMVSPLIESLAPAIDFIADKIVDLFNMINQLFARLTGKTTYVAAKKVATTWKDAASDAGHGAADAAHQAAEAIKRYTLAFDELNILGKTEKSSGSGGGGGGAGGGGGSGSGAGDLFERLPIDNDIANFADQLKSMFEAGDWEGLGRFLGDKVNGIVDSINWSGWGEKFGKAIDGAVKTSYFFLDEVNFRNIGNKIAEFLNGAMENIDFEFVGRLVAKPFTSLGDLLIGLIEGINWNLVGESLHDFIVGIFDEFSEWFDTYDWEKIGADLYQDLKDFFEGLRLEECADAFWETLGKALNAAMNILEGFITDGLVPDIKRWWKDEIEGETWQETAENFWDALGKGLDKYLPWNLYKEYIVDPFMRGLLGADTWDGMNEAATNIYTEFWDAVHLAFTNPAKAIDDFIVTPIANALGLGETWQDIKDAGRDLIDGLFAGIDEFFNHPEEFVKAHIVDPFVNNVKSLFGIASPSTVMKAIGEDVIKGLLNGITEFFSDPLGWVDEHIVRPFREKLKNFSLMDLISGDSSSSSTTANATVNVSLIRDGWTTLKAFVDQNTGGAASKAIGVAKDGWTTLQGFVNTYPGGAVSKVVGLARDGWNTVLGWLSGGDGSDGVDRRGGNVEKVVSLTKSWSTVLGWVNNYKGGNASKAVGLTKSWKNILSWVNLYKGGNASKPVSLTKSWKNILSWVNLYKGGNATKGVNLSKTWSSVASWVSGYTGGSVVKYINLAKTWKSVAGWVSDYVGGKVEVGVKLVKSGWSSIKSFFGLHSGGRILNGGGKFTFATGGVIHDGKWMENIPQYASGTRRAHGTMFIAGEDGPEIMGHVNGRTEILNKSQLASTMFAAVVNGMGTASNIMVSRLGERIVSSSNALSNAVLYSGQRTDEEMSALFNGFSISEPQRPRDDSADSMRLAMASATEQQNRLLRENNELLRQLLEKDTNVEITTKSLTSAMNRQNRRDGRTIVPVST